MICTSVADQSNRLILQGGAALTQKAAGGALATSAAVGLGAALLYGWTAAPTVGEFDSPELTAAAWHLGVAHPTGYPLYTLLGHAFTHLWSLGDAAWRLNLLSALLGGAAVGVLFAVSRRLCGDARAACGAVALFALSPTFWSQSTLAEVYTLHALLTAGVWLCWLRFDEVPSRARLAALAAMVGLSLTNHLMTLLLLPALSLGVLARAWPSFSQWLRPAMLLPVLGAGLAPLLIYLYLPWAASRDPAVNWGDPTSWPRFLFHVTGAQYHEMVGVPIGGLEAGLQAAGELGPVFGSLWLVLAGVGLAQCRRRGIAAFVVAVAFVTSLVFALTYDVVDRSVFFLSALEAGTLLVAMGLARSLRALERRLPAALALWGRGSVAWALVAAMVFSVFLLHVREQDRSRDYAPHDLAVAGLAAAPPKALLFTMGSRGYPPVYASLVEGLRPDVEVVDLWLRIRDDYGPLFEGIRHTQRPAGLERDAAVLLAASRETTRPLRLSPSSPDFDWEALGLVRLRTGAIDELVRGEVDLRSRAASVPALAEAADFGDIALRGAARSAGSLAPGGAIAFALSWGLGRDGADLEELEVVLLLADLDGNVLEGSRGGPLLSHSHPLGQGAPLAHYRRGDEIGERLVIPLPRAIAAGRYALWVGVREGERWLGSHGDRVFVPALEFEVGPQSAPLWSAQALYPVTDSDEASSTVSMTSRGDKRPM